MPKYTQLEKHSETLYTAMGAIFLGEKVIFRGKNLHQDLVDMSWMELNLFGITGRRFTPQQIRLMNAIWSYTSYPDARLWNNRVAALAGTTRSTGNLGLAGALAVSEAAIYGRGIDMRAIEFLFRAEQHVAGGGSLEQLIKEELKLRRSIAGYGRPAEMNDERIGPITELAQSLGLADGKYLTLAYQIEDVLVDGRWRIKINYGGVVAALGADLGLNVQEYYLYMSLAFFSGYIPCFIEARSHAAGVLFPTSVKQVQYEGVPPRAWERH